jgi:outer membrane protein assembly complex protein YaeT
MSLLRATRLAALLLFLPAASACVEEESGVQVKSLKFTGIEAVSDSQLKSVLATAVSSRLPWGDKFSFDRQQFEADLKRIVAFYRDRGYPKARVRSFDVKLSDDQKSVRLTIDIEEGEPIRVERVVFAGFDSLPADHFKALQDRLPLKPGAALDRAVMQASREAAIDELKDHGYPAPKVGVEEAAGSTDGVRVITYTAEPGRLAYVGSIDISGTSSVSERIVRRQLTFRRGQLFEQSKLRDSQRNLYSLELFNFVNVEALTAEAAPRQPDGNSSNGNGEQPIDAIDIPARVTVTEGKHRKVNFTVGYGSEEKARGEVDWRHVNFFGGARTAGVLARYSGLDRGVRLNFKQPYLFHPRYSFGLSGQSWFSDEPAFQLTTVGGRATITREFRRARSPIFGTPAAMSLSLTYVNEWEEYEISNDALNDPTFRDELIALGLDPRCGRGPKCFTDSPAGQLSSVFIDAGRNTTDSLLDARRGYVVIAHLESAGSWLGGDFDYRELSLEGRYYQALGTRAVVAVRARGGSIDPTRRAIQPDDGGPAIDEPVPFFKRYFLGGSGNLRGWGRFEVSPLSASGLPIGGQSFVNFSTEIRVPIVGNFSGVVFLDAGNVWRDSWNINLNDLRYNAGPGLRYKTPIGPVRLDLGYQLNPIPGLLVNGEEQKRQFRLHFSIGQAF